MCIRDRFQIDPRSFAVSLQQARAQYDKTGDSYLAQEKQVEAAEAQIAIAKASILQAQSGIKETASEIVKNSAEYQRQQQLLFAPIES